MSLPDSRTSRPSSIAQAMVARLSAPARPRPAPVAGDRGHVVPGDPASVGWLQQQAGVADDAVGGRLDGDHERLVRDRRPVDVALAELGQVAGRHRLVAAGDVLEGFDRDGVDALDQPRLPGKRGQPEAVGQVDRRPARVRPARGARSWTARTRGTRGGAGSRSPPAGPPRRACGARSCRRRGRDRRRPSAGSCRCPAGAPRPGRGSSPRTRRTPPAARRSGRPRRSRRGGRRPRR